MFMTNGWVLSIRSSQVTKRNEPFFDHDELYEKNRHIVVSEKLLPIVKEERMGRPQRHSATFPQESGRRITTTVRPSNHGQHKQIRATPEMCQREANFAMRVEERRKMLEVSTGGTHLQKPVLLQVLDTAIAIHRTCNWQECECDQRPI